MLIPSQEEANRNADSESDCKAIAAADAAAMSYPWQCLLRPNSCCRLLGPPINVGDGHQFHITQASRKNVHQNVANALP